MGKCIFSDAWVSDEEFKLWIIPVAGDKHSFRCRFCKKTRNLSNMGKTAIRTHAEGQRHKQLLKSETERSFASKITAYTTTNTNEKTTTVQTAAVSMLDIAGNSTDALKAEVLWTLRTAYCHHSYKSNDNIDQLFKAMFGDSAIAKLFSCGEDKTAYLLRFGLAPYFTQQLVAQLSAQNFVLMFDESLNKKNKMKQMDVHIRFWAYDTSSGEPNMLVKSHYFGSSFLGHAKAVDMVSHFKVSLLFETFFKNNMTD